MSLPGIRGAGGVVAKVGEHAIVLGASMGGLVAARVLADHFESVTVVERDLLPHDAAHRRGVPQGRHVHALLGRGCQVLGELFPGFTEELTAAGAPSFDYTDLSEVYFNVAGHEFPQTGGFSGLPPVITPSRCWKTWFGGGCARYRTSPCSTVMTSSV
jgi:hypothetical protein